MKNWRSSFKKNLIGLIFLGAAFVLVPQVSAGNINIITSKDTTVNTIDEKMLKEIFLGKKTIWPDGNKIEFVILKSGDAHEDFLKEFIKKTPSQFKTYWKKQVFTGKGKSPKYFETESDLVSYVSGRKGAVGYVSKSFNVDSVKVLNK